MFTILKSYYNFEESHRHIKLKNIIVSVLQKKKSSNTSQIKISLLLFYNNYDTQKTAEI